MPTIKIIDGFKITMYGNEHGAAHFHILDGDDAAKVNIENLEVMAGSVDRRTLNKAREWAADNKDLLIAKWKEFNQ